MRFDPSRCPPSFIAEIPVSFYAAGMKRLFIIAALACLPASAEAKYSEFSPDSVNEVDAINCRLDAPSYNGFAFAVVGKANLAARRHWKKVVSSNPFMDEYDLPAPVLVTGTYRTSRIAFTSTGILAILDLADPTILAREEGIANAADPEPLIAELVATGKVTRAEIEADMKFRKFLGERVLVDTKELPKDDESFGAHTIISRNISNVTSHPGKTLYGCSYKIELIDKDGKPL